MHTLVLENDEAQCDAPCHNTNVFAPGAYKVKCDTCHGRRGHYGQDHQWVECRQGREAGPCAWEADGSSDTDLREAAAIGHLQVRF